MSAQPLQPSRSLAPAAPAPCIPHFSYQPSDDCRCAGVV